MRAVLYCVHFKLLHAAIGPALSKTVFLKTPRDVAFDRPFGAFANNKRLNTATLPLCA